MKSGRLLAVGAILLLFAAASPAFASSPPNNLSLSMSGAILDSGSQTYSHTGGQLVAAVIGGVSVTDSHAVLHYSLKASVSELTVSGSAEFSLLTHDSHGTFYDVQGTAEINGMVAAESFPLGCTPGVDCASGIPGLFLGTASVEVQSCHGNPNAGHCDTLLSETVPMSFESAFLNPFGGPIFMATADNAVFIESDYSASRVTWTGIQLGGTLSGNLAGSPVSGNFLMTVSAFEDLRAGYEIDHGSIAFLSGNPAVNAAGTFAGLSKIPAGSPCPDSLGFPPGTCQITGFNSAGIFYQTNSLGGSMVGRYSTSWIAPAVAFTSTVSATVKQAPADS